MHTPSRHRPLVLAYDSNPTSAGTVMIAPANVAAGGRALLSTRLSPGLFAAAAMRKVQKDLVAMKVVELKEELGERGEALSGNKAWLRRRLHAAIVSEYLESAAGAAGEYVECPKFSRACGARLYHFAPGGPTFVVLPQIYA